MADGAIKSLADFEPTPQGLAERWEQELAAADDAVKDWHERAKRIEDRYQDARKQTGSAGRAKLNLFHADIEMNKAIVYDNDPKVHCRRRYADADDDVARVSAEILDRHLNADIESGDDGFTDALALARDDRLLVGLGQVRFRYVVDWEEVPETPAQVNAEGAVIAEAVPSAKRKVYENVECDHVVWEDFRWSPCRNRREVRWMAFGVEMTLDEARKRFPNVDVEKLPTVSRREDVSPENKDTWTRIRLWEIWDKMTKKRYLHVRGHDSVLEVQDDPLGLSGFFPCPTPMMANLVTRSFMPVPDYTLAQDLYDEIDDYTDRIHQLVKFAIVVGACDKGNEALTTLLTTAKEGKIIPLENYRSLIGQGVGDVPPVWMFPLEPIIGVINSLVAKRQESIQQLYQVTGNSDMMRGTGLVKTATQSRMEGRFGASRTRSRQKELAKFAQSAQRIRAEIIARWFDPQTIIARSNIEAAETVVVQPPPPPPTAPGAPPPAPQQPKRVPNRLLISQAVQLLKSDISNYRIEIAEDSLALTDYDAIKQERIEYIQALATFLQSVMPLMQDPQQRPYILRLGQWLLAGMSGSSQAETIFDEAVRLAEKAAAQPPAPPPPDPKLQQIQVQTQADIAKKKVDVQAHTAMKQIDVQAERAKQVAQAEFARPIPPNPGMEEI